MNFPVESFHHRDCYIPCAVSQCSDVYITITLQKRYDILFITIRQRGIDSVNWFKSFFIKFDDHAQKSYKCNYLINHYLLEKFEGTQVENIKFSPDGEKATSKNFGFNHIIAYSYTNGKYMLKNSQTFLIYEIFFYKNYLDPGLNWNFKLREAIINLKTCSASSSTGDGPCENAFSRFTAENWIADCGVSNKPSCIGQYIIADLPDYKNVYKLCFTNR